MAWAYRTGTYNDVGLGWTTLSTGGTATLATGAAVSSGDMLVVGVIHTDRTSATTPSFAFSDTINGSTNWFEASTVAFTDGGTNLRASIWACPNSGAGTPTITVTVTWTGGGTGFGGMACAAFSGLSTTSPNKDQSAAAANTAVSSQTSGASAATTGANELVVGVYVDPGYGTTIASGNIGGSAATQIGIHQNDGNNWEGLIEVLDSGSAGATPSATVTTGTATTSGMLEAIFKLPASAQDTPELRGRPFGLHGQVQMHQLLAQ